MSVSIVNTPRFQITMNGQMLEGVTRVQVSLPLNFCIGHFSFEKAFVPEDAFPAFWWAGTGSKTMFVTIALSVDGTTFQQVIAGNVDNHLYDPIANCVSVAGRDLAAAMCDERIVNTYRNQTASQVAAIFAAEHGLIANITPTTSLAGRYYDTDHDETNAGNFSFASNEWDLLCRLGSEEGITPFVMGNTLFFNPPADSPPIFPIAFSQFAGGGVAANVMDLKLERHMTEARDIVVTVRSWNSRSKATFSATIRTSTTSPSFEAGARLANYLVVMPNLTQAECLAKAQQIALDYAQHERNLFAVYPSLGVMDPRAVIQLSGTGTDYDIVYYPQKVTYCVDFGGGGRTEIFAKSSSPLALYDNDTNEQIESSSNVQ